MLVEDFLTADEEELVCRHVDAIFREKAGTELLLAGVQGAGRASVADEPVAAGAALWARVRLRAPRHRLRPAVQPDAGGGAGHGRQGAGAGTGGVRSGPVHH
jgi:hypothetical protein